MKMNKTIEYYMSLPYRIEVIKIPEEKGGGYMACLPQFGRMAAVGDGENVEQAVANLEESKKALFEDYIEEGIEIPEPEGDLEEYSGKFVLRVPRYLHRELSLEAKKNGASLNQYAASLLSVGVERDKLSSGLIKLTDELKLLRVDVCKLQYEKAGFILLDRIPLPESYEADEARAA